MKAAYYTGNKTFSVESIDSIGPSHNEVQIKIGFCGVCGTDMHVYQGHMDQRVGFHRVIGHEMSGTITEVGDNVTALSIGENVVVRPLVSCGNCPACTKGHNHICQNLAFLGLDTDGAMQQRWNVPAETVHKIPDDMSLQHAALVEPLAVACHDVERCQLSADEDAVVIGAGPIGLLVAMVARQRGANVIVVEVNEYRLKLAQQMGFMTVNPTSSNAADIVNQVTNKKGADVVFEVSGTQSGVDCMTDVAGVRGRIVMVAIHAKKPQIDLFQFFWRELELFGARVYSADDFERAIDLIQRGDIDCENMISKVYDLEQINTAFEELSGNPEIMKTLIQAN